ncbi:hypothetical protein FSP39_022355 [Pinctada imbricata]|uniref:Neural-cadherin n=1 Tax=Pinctada imbricata TaxID=66713 RepID=A0AA89BPU7_PINIB|nr:hypothetical protein FSP39_022355 [Pinctada imbricata]
MPGFDGARCQQTTHSFSNGYVLYPPLAQCEDSVTSIEFATRMDTALIFYNGPSGSLANHQPRDFVSLALISGYPQVIVDHGSGNVTLYVDGKAVRVIVDRCQSSEFLSGSESVEDRRPCEASGSTLGRNKYLNVNHMLQMGGRYDVLEYPPGLTRRRFDGCIRNFIHNGELYDLHTSRHHPGENHRNGCPEEDSVCNTIQGQKCGPRGRCQMVVLGQSDVECTCDPGFRPSEPGSKKCDTKTSVRDLKSRSYMTWTLKNEMFNMLAKQEVSFQIRFRTRDPDGGILLHLPSNSQEFITLQIVNNHVELTYNLRDDTSSLFDHSLSLSSAPANNGQWHTVHVHRIGRWFQLKMDSGEGRYFNETFGSNKDSQFFYMKRDQIVAGARVSFDPSAYYNGKGLTQTCITDIRIDNMWFPMKSDENSISPAAILEHSPEVEHGCNRTDCLGVRCPAPDENYIAQVCYPLFDHYECRCPKGTQPYTGVSCQPIKFCTDPSPCKAGGRCIELVEKRTFRCDCPKGWIGPTCNQQASTVPEGAVFTAGVTPEVIIIIVVSVFAVLLIASLVFLLLWVVNRGSREKSILYDDQYDDIRENVMDHDEEGAGEEDQDCYDISRLQKPNSSMDRYQPLTAKLLGRSYTGDPPDVGDFIEDKLRDIDEDPTAPPHDNVMEFDFEGFGSDAGSLSSLNTASSDNDQEYNYLEDWGPKFAKLANMYNSGEEDL